MDLCRKNAVLPTTVGEQKCVKSVHIFTITHSCVAIMTYRLSDFVLIYLGGHCEVITSLTAAQHKDRIMGSSGTETGRDGNPGGPDE